LIKFYQKVIAPNLQLAAGKTTGKPTPAYTIDEAIDWVLGLSPAMYYWRDAFQSVDGPVVFEEFKQGDLSKAASDLMENMQKPNVWIRDSQGNKAYQVGGLQDRVLLTFGAAPVNKTQAQVLNEIWIRNEKIRKENRNKWYNKVSRRFLDGLEITTDLWDDAILYRIDPASLPTAIQFKEMTPQQRRTLKANLFEKADAFEHFNLEGE
jgi:hypothetical protein